MALTRDLGIDLGTSNVLVFARRQGIVLREPCVVAINRKTNRLMAVGEEARQMLGRTPDHITTIQPVRDGVIADYSATQQLLAEFIRSIAGKNPLFKPYVIVAVPSGVTNVERRAVLDAARAAGARDAFPIEEPMAAALGAGLDIRLPAGNMVVDIGGGTTDIAVISLGGIVVSDSLRVGGQKMDDAINRHLRREYNLLVGDRTAEEIKIAIGSAYRLETELRLEVKGRDQVAGLPKTVFVSSDEIREALSEPVTQIIERVKHVLEQTPPELAADIATRGIVLTGGCALLRRMDVLLARECGVPVHVTEDPLSCVALGTGKALEQIDRLRASAGRTA